MANFNTHITIAGIGSVAATLCCAFQVDLTLLDLSILFALGVVAGLLPDIDSDHSVPLRWMFRLLIFIAAGLVMHFTAAESMLYTLVCLIIVILLLHIVVFRVFKKLTVHRGLFHSVPAAAILGLAVLWLGLHVFMWTLLFSWLAASFVCGGYLLHLLLDEVFSVDFRGGQLKASFGTALTVFSCKSWAAYCVLYAVVFLGMILLPMPDFKAIVL